MNPTISVIIPAHQEEEQISDTLDSCINQSYHDFEVIVVANGCTDNTAKIAESYKPKLNLKLIETKKTGIGYSCNAGYEKSNGRIITILEADTILSNNALEEIYKSVNQGNVGGTLAMKTKEKRFQYTVLATLQRIGKGGGWGPLRFCTSSVYENIKGHRENADFGVDCDFAEKVKSFGGTKFISNAHYITSMRRFEKLGVKELVRQSIEYMKNQWFGKESPKRDYAVVR